MTPYSNPYSKTAKTAYGGGFGHVVELLNCYFLFLQEQIKGIIIIMGL